MTPLRNILVGFLLLIVSAVQGQALTIAFNPASASGAVGSTVSVDVIATTCNGIISMQFPILYNKDILQVSTIQMPNPSPLNQFVYLAPPAPPATQGGNVVHKVDGKIAVSWGEPTGAPTTLPANTKLFTIVFTVKATGTAPIYIGNAAPPAIEVVGTGGVNATFTYPTAPAGPVSINGFAIYPAGFPSSDQAQVGELFCVPIMVNDFNEIVGMQYVLNWNPAVLTYSHTQGYNLSGLDCTSFNFNSIAAPGRLVVTWNDATTQGITIPNATSIFEVCFTASGASGSTSTLVANGSGLPPGSPPAVENTVGTNVWTSTSGISTTLSVNNSATPEIEVVQLKLDTVDVASGANQICIPVRVTKFKNINSAQFVVNYDPAILGSPTLTSTITPAATGTTSGMPSGKYKVTWSDGTPAGKTLADGSIMLNVCFSVIGGTPGAETPITISNLPAQGGNPAVDLKVTERSALCFYTPLTRPGLVKLPTGPAPLVVTLNTKTDINCWGASTGAIDINVSGGNVSNPYTYLWTGPGLSAANNSTQDLTNLATGTYNVTVTAGTATTSLTVSLTQPASAVAFGSPALTNVLCAGASNGAINITATGGTAPYTYNWGAGVTTEDRTGLAAGTYTVIVTDNKGCSTVSQNYTLTAPPALSFVGQPTVSNVKCLGTNSASITLNSTGGTGTKTYNWRDQANVAYTGNATVNSLPAGSYNVTVTDANGCVLAFPTSIAVSAPPSQFSAASTKVDVPCTGVNSGSITVSTTGGWPGNPSIQWSNPVPGSGGFTPTGVGIGTYTASVTDAQGCLVVMPAVQIVANANAPTTGTPQITNVNCHNAGNGSIALPISGVYQSITWKDQGGNDVGSGATVSGLAGGSYTATITYGGGSCTTTVGPLSVDNPSAIETTGTTTIPWSPTSLGSIDLNVVGGVAPFSYAWSGTTQTSQDITGLLAGTYTVTITDARNCQKIEAIIVGSTNLLAGSTAATTNSCDDDGCINIFIPAVAQGPFVVTFVGTSMPVPQTEAFTTYTYSLCNLKAGVYSVVVTDATNTTFTIPNAGTSSTTIVQNSPVQLTSNVVQPIQAQANGNITLSAAPGLPLSYAWSPNVPANISVSPVVFGLDQGVYCVTVTNQLSQCTKEYCFTLVRKYDDLSINAPTSANPSCFNSTNGTISISANGGAAPYTYLWSGPNNFTASTATITNLAQGTYSVTITDGQNLTITSPAPITLTAQSQLSITNVNEISNYNGFQVAGSGVCNGFANAVQTGGSGNVSFAWSNGFLGTNNTTLCGGAYSVTATDAVGCTSVWTNELTVPAAIAASSTPATDYNGFNVSCYGKCDGAARVQVNGGVGPYVIKWDNGQTDQVFNSFGYSQSDDLCGGAHAVTITDANGVVVNYEVVVTSPDQFLLDFTETAPTTLANCNGEIIVAISGAVGATTVKWHSQFHQGEGMRADGLCAEELVLFEVTDENGCIAEGENEVPFPKDGCYLVRPVITPNGDGDNDFTKITCFENVNNSVEIYDRWGQLVYQATNYDNAGNSWDGTRSGQALPEGAYFYVATFVDDLGADHVIKGYINLIK